MKVLLLVLLFISPLTFAETIKSFQVSKSNPNLEKISLSFEIKEKNTSGYLVYVLKEKLSLFTKLAPKAKLISNDINFELKQKGVPAGYHSFADVKKFSKEMTVRFPKLVKEVSYGKSKNELPLFSIKITNQDSTNTSKKKLMITSATHGDELITVEVLMALTRELIEGYKSNPRFKNILDNVELHIILVVNPEGYTRRSRYAGGIDPNRQYPWPGHPNRRTPVPAIDAIMKFFKVKNFDGSMDIHASGKMVMFPWGYTRDLINGADHKVFDDLTKNMAIDNRYKHGPISRVIYVAKGSSADFYYEHNGALAVAIELTTTKVPRASRIPAVIKEAREMLLKYYEHFI